MGGLLVPDTDIEPAAFGRDGQVAVTEATDEIERLSQRLFVRKPHRVGCDCFLDGGAHVRSRAEEAVCRDKALECLVRTLEVVRVDEKLNASVAISEVGKDGAREKLVPKRLPEALDLAERLRVLRSALDVANAVEMELPLEVGLAAPRRVLTALVGENLTRLSERGDAPLQRFDDELRALMVREVVRDDEPRMIIHERGHVEALVATQEKREDVGLPKLIGLCTLEATRCMLARPSGHMLFDETCFAKDAADGGLRDAKADEAREEVADATRAKLGLLLAQRDDVLTLHLASEWRALLFDARTRLRAERVRSPHPVDGDPLLQRRHRDAELPGDLRLCRLLLGNDA